VPLSLSLTDSAAGLRVLRLCAPVPFTGRAAQNPWRLEFFGHFYAEDLVQARILALVSYIHELQQ